MGIGGGRVLSGKLVVGALIGLTVFVSAVRPVTRPTGRLNRPLGLTRWSLLSEAAGDTSGPLPQPAVTDVEVVAVPVLSVPPVLNTRPATFRPVSVRRLKLPPRSTTDSPLSD